MKIPSVLWSHVAVIEGRTCSEVLVGNEPALHAQGRDALSYRQKEQIQIFGGFKRWYLPKLLPQLANALYWT